MKRKVERKMRGMREKYRGGMTLEKDEGKISPAEKLARMRPAVPMPGRLLEKTGEKPRDGTKREKKEAEMAARLLRLALQMAESDDRDRF